MTRALIVGWGVTGQAVCRHLRDEGTEVTIVDDQPRVGDEQAQATGARLIQAPTEAELARLVASSEFIVPSPGVPLAHPVYRLAAEAGVEVLSEIELAWRRLAATGPGGSQRPRLVAVTGTNGKTTVTTLVAAILTASGRRAVAAGNIGVPLLDAVGQPTDVLVAEVSSFQLQFAKAFRPDVSCWLNLAEDHLDWHPTMAHYALAKARIWAAQGDNDVAVLNADDPAVMAAASDPHRGVPTGVARRTFSIVGPADFHLNARRVLVGPGDVPLVDAALVRRALPHDLANGLAAAACALAVGATAEGCRQALESFETLPHRVQLIGESGGVAWYDDSKATTPASVLAAVAGFDSVLLIAGGRNKGLDLGALSATAPPVRAVIAIGEATADVEQAFLGRVPVTRAATMADAVTAAMSESKPGDVVLLSPGCASFDWYHSYGERGDHFTQLVTAQLRPRESTG